MLDIFRNLVTAINNQTALTQSIESKLNELEVGGGGGSVPIATTTSPGIVQVGNNLTITPEGVLSATGGGGPVGPIHASDVIYDNTASGTSVTEVQSSLDEIYALIGDVNTVLNSII